MKKNVMAIKTLIFEIGWYFKRKYKYLGLNNYPAIHLPYEPSQELRSPHICLGTDVYHSPEDLIELIRNFFEEINLTNEINI